MLPAALGLWAPVVKETPKVSALKKGDYVSD